MACRQGGQESPTEGKGQGNHGPDKGHRRKEAELSGSSGLVLGIETATPHGGVAVAGKGEVLAELQLLNPRSHSERLLPAIDTLLGSAGLAAGDLAAVAVSNGPGSFTGLRIGVAAAKGLAFSLGLPLYGVPTLEVLAGNASPGKRAVCAVVDARRGELFAALFRFAGGELEKVWGEGILTPEDLVSRLPGDTVLFGRLPGLFLEALEKGGKPFYCAPSHLSYPRAAVVARAGEGMLSLGAASETDTLTPRYLRPSDAESNRRKKERENKVI